MRKLTVALSIVALVASFAFVSTASAADPVQKGISSDLLAKMGLGGMDKISDEEGKQIRGQGFASPQINVAIVTVVGRNNKVNVSQSNSSGRRNFFSPQTNVADVAVIGGRGNRVNVRQSNRGR